MVNIQYTLPVERVEEESGVTMVRASVKILLCHLAMAHVHMLKTSFKSSLTCWIETGHPCGLTSSASKAASICKWESRWPGQQSGRLAHERMCFG